MQKICFNVQDLQKSFSEKLIFNDISFSLTKGDSLAIIGKNGSGKSTLIKIISQLLTSDKGEIKLSIDSKNIAREKFKNHLGFASPYLHFYEELTGLENIEFFLKLKNSNNNIDRISNEKINFLFDTMQIADARNVYVRNYSSGMKQRLKIIFALINDPPLLIFDEPSSNLDKSGQDILYSIYKKHIEKGILIIATNDEREVQFCNRIIDIEQFKN